MPEPEESWREAWENLTASLIDLTRQVADSQALITSTLRVVADTHRMLWELQIKEAKEAVRASKPKKKKKEESE